MSKKELDWREIAIAMYDNNYKKIDIFNYLDGIGYDVNYNTIKSYLYRNGRKDFKRSKDDLASTMTDITGQMTLSKFVEEAKKKEKKVALQNNDPKITEVDWSKETRVIKFGLMGDTQMGSKYAQLTHLNAFYDICQTLGVKDVYHTGDISDGIKMRPGHEYELYAISADEMKDDIVKNYPKREGITTHFITGNHDASLYKHVGYDIGNAIALERDDMEYLGRDCAIVKLTPNCILELRHPWDGTAYAQSYKIQKMIESMEADSKPNILAVGHYHKVEYMFYRNVHAFQTGCFQSQTPFTRGKGISVHMGGWIIAVEVDKEGKIIRITQQFVPFYAPIKDDYKKYKGE